MAICQERCEEDHVYGLGIALSDSHTTMGVVGVGLDDSRQAWQICI